MALLNITIEKVIVKADDTLLKEIICKLDQLLSVNDAVIAKAASDLDASTNQLKDAVDKNAPAS